MKSPQGITTTAGIAIMAIVIVAVGVAVFFVYQSTQNGSTVSFAIESKDRLVLEAGQSENLTFLVTSPNTADRIDLALQTTGEAEAALPKNNIQAGEQITVEVKAISVTDAGKLTLIAEQAGEHIEREVSVRIFSVAANTNTTNTATNSQNTNTLNTNTSSNTNAGQDQLRFSDPELNFTMLYPASWGESSDNVLERLAPFQGDMKYVYFQNLVRYDLPGHIAITATSEDYIPTEFTGSPYWYAGSINPELSKDRLIEQIQLAGIYPLDVESVTIDGVDAIKVYAYRGYFHHYLDVNYLIPFKDNGSYDTLMILRTIDLVTEDDDTELADAVALAREAMGKLKAGELDEQSMRRYQQLEDAIKTFEFLQ